jgi:hypothetical protein
MTHWCARCVTSMDLHQHRSRPSSTRRAAKWVWIETQVRRFGSDSLGYAYGSPEVASLFGKNFHRAPPVALVVSGGRFLMMMHMPWVLAVLFLFLILVAGGAFAAVRRMANATKQDHPR